MNFLELAQEVRRGVGLQGTGPSSITGATEIEKNIIDSVRDAWLDIQNQRQEWLWMRSSVTFLTSTDSTYSLMNIFGPTYRFKNWIKETVYALVDDKWRWVRYVDYDTFIYRNQNLTTSRYPTEFTIVPWNNSLMFNNLDKPYSIKVDYFKSPQRLVAASDVPEFPEAYHVMIKYHAIAKFCTIVVVPEVHQENSIQYATMMGNLMRDQLKKKRVRLTGIA